MISYDVPDWNVSIYSDRGEVEMMSRPWRMVHPEKSDRAVVCLHGFTGFPGQLIRPGRDLYEAGFDVFAPRYPGHGTSAEDFMATDGPMWVESAASAVRDVKASYSEVYLVGHSMGGAVATLIADRFDIKKMALIAPALQCSAFQSPRAVWKLKIARHFRKKVKSGFWDRNEILAYWEEGTPTERAEHDKIYFDYMYPPQLWELYKLCEQAKETCNQVKSDTLAIAGELDDTVPLQSVKMLAEKPLGNNRMEVIGKAIHIMPFQKEKEIQDQMASLVVNWLL